MNLTSSFTVAEFEFSETAARHGIDNTMPLGAIENARRLCKHILQPCRDEWLRPIYITSGYRSPELNRRIRGARNSQHMQGLAVDFVVRGWTPKEICDRMIDMDLPVDQLILEFGKWVHVSWSPEPRGQLLTAYKSPTNRTKYAQGITTEYFA